LLNVKPVGALRKQKVNTRNDKNTNPDIAPHSAPVKVCEKKFLIIVYSLNCHYRKVVTICGEQRVALYQGLCQYFL
jgi:hypothetical protein